MTIKLLTLLSLAICCAPIAATNLRTSIRTEYYLQQARDASAAPNTRVAYYDSVIVSMGNDATPAIYFEKASLLENGGFYPRALAVYHDAAAIVDTTNRSDRCRLLLNSAVAAYHSNKMREAVRDAYSIFTIQKHDSMLHYDMDAYRLLSFITCRSGNFPMSLELLDKAWKSYEKSKPYIRDATRRNHILCRLYFAQSQVSMAQGKWQLAFDQLKKAEDTASDPLMEADIYGALGHLCELCDNLTAAEEFYKKALSFNDNHPNRAVNLDYYIRLQLRLGNTGLAAKLLQDNNEFFNALAGSQAEPQIEMLRYQVAKSVGDNKTALEALEKVVAINDSDAMYQDSTYIKELINEYENRDIDNERIRLTRAIGIRNYTIIALAVLLIAAIAAIARMIMLHRRKAKENRLLSDSLSSIKRQHDEQHLNDAANIDNQRKKLLTMSMSYKNVTDALNEILSLCADTGKTPEKRLESIRAILKQLSSRNNVTKMFSIYFEGINETFFNRLFKLHPGLSAAEIRMSGFMLMGLTTKEIAVLTNRSVRTVENIKYTLRKKLDIEEASESYFRRIVSWSDDEFLAHIS